MRLNFHGLLPDLRSMGAALLFSLTLHGLLAALASLSWHGSSRPESMRVDPVLRVVLLAAPATAASVEPQAPLPVVPKVSKPQPRAARKPVQKKVSASTRKESSAPQPASAANTDAPMASKAEQASMDEPATAAPPAAALPDGAGESGRVDSPRLASQHGAASESSGSSAGAVVAADPELLRSAQPDYAYNPPPEYPMALREQGIDGVVWLKVLVDRDGRPSEVRIARGSGYRLLDAAALRAVKSWRFIPARRGGTTLASWVELPIRFALNG